MVERISAAKEKHASNVYYIENSGEKMTKTSTLVHQAQDGDRQALEKLVARFDRYVFGVALLTLGNRAEAQDAAQEALIKAIRGLSKYDGRAAFRTWLYRITVNTCRNELRRRSRQPTLLEPDLESLGILLPTASSAEQVIIAHEQQDAVQETLNQLNATHREALILRDIQGLSYQEIAAVLGIGLSAAKMRVRRARLAFREVYSRET